MPLGFDSLVANCKLQAVRAILFGHGKHFLITIKEHIGICLHKYISATLNLENMSISLNAGQSCYCTRQVHDGLERGARAGGQVVGGQEI